MEAVHHFDHFEVRPSQRQLLVGGLPVALGARAFDLLLTLIERRGNLVSKNELLDAVWPGLVVEENNLTVQISALRKLLGAAAIATIPGRGYRLTADASGQAVAEATAPPGPASREADSASSTPTNLPDELPALYGRRDDVQSLRRLLEQHRLVTLIGAGGIGKTRLAQAVAHALRQRWPDGAWVVELAALTEPALVPSTVAQALGIRLPGQRPARDELLGGLRPLGLLLVLDNCEHLLGAVSALAQAIAAGAPKVRVLATSQEPLKVADEQQFRMVPLAVPASAGDADAAEFGALALFEARVRAVDRRFALAPQNLGAAIDICRRLDGLPLAIELAAVRVPLLGVQGVRDRLDERFDLLTGGSRVALRRHQTLHAALEWSHGLLSPDEQAVFRRLGVFAGSFGIELVRAVLGPGEHGDEWAVIDTLAALVDKSLVVAQAGDPPRYHLLESTRAYALRQLAQTGETAAYLERHSLAVRARFERVHDALVEGLLSSVQADEMLAPDLANLRAAHRWASEPGGDLPTALSLAASADAIEDIDAETVAWLLALEPRVERAGSAKPVADFWLAMTGTATYRRLPLAAQPAKAKRAAALYAELQLPRHAFRSLLNAIGRLAELGDLDAADRALAEARRLLQPTWPPALRARLLAAAALTEGYRQSSEAAPLWEEEIAIQASIGDWRREASARTSLADFHWAMGRVEEACKQFSEIASTLRKMNAGPNLAPCWAIWRAHSSSSGVRTRPWPSPQKSFPIYAEMHPCTSSPMAWPICWFNSANPLPRRA